MEKLNTEELYHLIDILELHNKDVKKNLLMSDKMKQDSIKYQNKIINKFKKRVEKQR